MTENGNQIVTKTESVKIHATAESLDSLVDKIVNDEDFQREFEENPQAVLGRYGVDIPESVIPDKVDVRAVIADMNRVNEAIAAPYVRVAVVVAVAVAPAPTAVLSSLEKEIPGTSKMPEEGPE